MCTLVSLAGPLATIVAAAVAVVVTWHLGKGQQRIAEQQAATARQQAELAAVRLQHDLFDRRFAIYEAAEKLITEVFMTSKVSTESLRLFLQNTEKSVFLLDKELSDYLTDMRKRAERLLVAAAKLDGIFPEGEERSEVAKERADLSKWFVEQFHELTEKFKPVLALDKWERVSSSKSE